ncbi:MAG: 2-phosphosulfolactate phosphatase family protein [Planctomycetaceae bacterium]
MWTVRCLAGFRAGAYHRVMTREVHTHFLPTLFEPEDLRGGIAVVIDVLRASTTICHALAAGVDSIIPVESVEQARERAANLPYESAVLGGERNGLRIEGFDLDNSPFSCTEENLAGRTLVFTTTNGTKAMLRARLAECILIGTFNNLAVVVEQIRSSDKSVHLVCAGTDGNITAEDVLFAGAVLHRLCENHEFPEIPDDPSRLALNSYRRIAKSEESEALLQALRGCLGGRNLRSLGMDADIERAAELDRFHFVPIYSTQTGRIIQTEN